jgi:hypothetical protein
MKKFSGWVDGVPAQLRPILTAHETSLLPNHCLAVTRGIGRNDSRWKGGKAGICCTREMNHTEAGHPNVVRDFTVIELSCSSL